MPENSDFYLLSPALSKGVDGVWYGSAKEMVSYPEDGNKICLDIEERSFWFQHRNTCIIETIKLFSQACNFPLFDIGGGNGFVTLALKNAGIGAVLVEPGMTGVINAKKRGIEDIICATTQSAQFNKGVLPSVGLFDVLEHIENDNEFLSSVNGYLRNDGLLYITVPSYRFLWSKDDEIAGHFRRYSLSGLDAILNTAGFDVIYSTYIFRFLPPPIFLFRTLPSMLGIGMMSRTKEKIKDEHDVSNRAVSATLDFLLSSEIHNIQMKKIMHFGGSCLVVARKRL